MDLTKYLENLSNIKLNKNIRVVLLALYAFVMFFTIASEINMVGFILLFVVTPISIYFIVKNIFPKKSDEREV